MFKHTDLMSDGLRNRNELNSATKVSISKEAQDRSRVQAQIDLDKHKLAFLKEHEKQDAEEIERRKQWMIKTDRGLKYSEMAKIVTQPSKLHDMCLLGRLDEVIKLVEEQNANVDGVTTDLETCLDAARRGKELMDKAGHKKNEQVDHNVVVSYLVQRDAHTYGEVVLRQKRAVEDEMAKDKKWDKIKAIGVIVALVLFLITLYIIKPGRRAVIHEEHTEL